MRINDKTLQRAESILRNSKGVYSAVMRVESGDGSFVWTTSTGDMAKEGQFYIASVTKLYITTLILTLEKEGKLKLSDPIHLYLPKEMIHQLHVYKDRDYSNEITIRQLISNTSGLPDYFFHKLPDNTTFASNILGNKDISLTLEETIEYVKKLKPKFFPGEKRKAAYSDTNYQLLGRIIEKVTQMTIHEAFDHMIFHPLGLKHTYTYADPTDVRPEPFYYKDKKLWVPNYMVSITSEGGIVSTSEEVMTYTKSFFQGKWIELENIELLKDWRLILPPPSMFYFGLGLEKLFIPRFVSPLYPITDVLGFWGQTGSFAWYSPQTDLYFTGTTNQIDGNGHAAAMKVIIAIIKDSLKSAK
jgi:D-alanyl-D-alanine carboxypeptidase